MDPSNVLATAGDGAVDRLLGEVGRLGQVLGGDWLGIAFIAGCVVVAGWAANTLLRVLARTGYGQRRWLTMVGLAVEAVIVLSLALLVFRRVFAVAPAITTLFAMALIAAVVLSGVRHFPATVRGTLVLLRGEVHEGDRLIGTELSGTVERVGLFHLVLRRVDGAAATVPLRFLGAEVLTVASPQRTWPVEVQWPVGRAVAGEEIEYLRRAVSMCPYRLAASQPSVSVGGETDSLVTIRLLTWSADASFLAEGFLRRVFANTFAAAATENGRPT